MRTTSTAGPSPRRAVALRSFPGVLPDHVRDWSVTGPPRTPRGLRPPLLAARRSPLGTQPVRSRAGGPFPGRVGCEGLVDLEGRGPCSVLGGGHEGSETVAGRPLSFRSDDVDVFGSRRWYPGPTGVRGGSRPGRRSRRRERPRYGLTVVSAERYGVRGRVGEGAKGRDGGGAPKAACDTELVPLGCGDVTRTSTPHSRRRHEQTCERPPLDGG
jgi:hypothetical protein